jgi:predicted Zn-dependent protease
MMTRCFKEPMGRIELLEQFIAQNPGDPFPRYGLAIELKNGGRLDEAERTFSELMLRFPDYTAAYLHAGNVLVQLGKRSEAAEIYRKGIDVCGKKRDEHARSELAAALAAVEGGVDGDEEVQP